MRTRRPASLSLLLIPVLAHLAAGQTITVDTVEDVEDFAAPKTVAQLPGPDGRVSLREAVAAANNTAGPQTIGFRIPQSEWWMDSLGPWIKINGQGFYLTSDDTTIDATTQTAFTGDTNPDGPEVRFWNVNPAWSFDVVFWLPSDNCVIKGTGEEHGRASYVIIDGNNNTVTGCNLAGAFQDVVVVRGDDNVIGGAGADGNIIPGGDSGISIEPGATGNRVLGNVITGAHWYGIHVKSTADGNTIGGLLPGEGNILRHAGHPSPESGNMLGVDVLIEGDQNLVFGNWFGLQDSGLSSAGNNSNAGVEIRGGKSNVIGAPGAGNVFGGYTTLKSAEAGLLLTGGADNNKIQANLFGLGADGSTPVPCGKGIFFDQGPTSPIDRPDSNLIGGDQPGEANHIANNLEIGVHIRWGDHGNRLVRNRIENNGQLGIDLDKDWVPGVTQNDPMDLDTGPNGLQNFPVLDLATTTSPTEVKVTGSLNSSPNRSFAIEWYANVQCGPNAHGQGGEWLATTTVATDALGNAAVEATFPLAQVSGKAISTTATDLSNGDTSEFSPCVQVPSCSGVAWPFGNGCPGTGGFTPSLSLSGCPEPGSPVQVSIASGLGGSTALLVIGAAPAQVPIGFGCSLLVAPVLAPPLSIPLGGSGPGTGSAVLIGALPPSASGVSVALQAFVLDTANPIGASASNGVGLQTP